MIATILRWWLRRELPTDDDYAAADPGANYVPTAGAVMPVAAHITVTATATHPQDGPRRETP